LITKNANASLPKPSRNIARRDDDERELAERQERNSIGQDQWRDNAELDRLEQLRASLPPHPEPGLDTYKPDWATFIDGRVAQALSAERQQERERAFDILAEVIAAERADVERTVAGLRYSIDRLRAELRKQRLEIEELTKRSADGADGVVPIRYRRNDAA
jgi:hypothetical protein